MLAGAAIGLTLAVAGATGATPAFACGPHHQGNAHRGPDCPGHMGGSPNDGIILKGRGIAAGFTRTEYCKQTRPWAEPHRSVDHGILYEWYYVWSREYVSGAPFGFGHHRHETPMILVCPRAHEPVEVQHTGPEGDGEMLPCPKIDDYQTRPSEDGAAWSISNTTSLAGQDEPSHTALLHHVRGGLATAATGSGITGSTTRSRSASFMRHSPACAEHWGATELSRPH